MDLQAADPIIPLLYESTEEGKKVCASRLLRASLCLAHDMPRGPGPAHARAHIVRISTPYGLVLCPCTNAATGVEQVMRNKAAGCDHGDGDIRVAVFRRVADPAETTTEATSSAEIEPVAKRRREGEGGAALR